MTDRVPQPPDASATRPAAGADAPATPLGATVPIRTPVLQVGDRRMLLTIGRPLLIGSGPDADVRIRHASVTPHHVRIEGLADGDVRIEDLSDGQTRVNGFALRKGQVPTNSVLQIGEIELQLAPRAGFVVLPKVGADRSVDYTFRGMMAHELRRAPWVSLSLFLHALLILVLAVLLRPEPVQIPRPLRVSVVAGETVRAEEEPQVEVDVLEEQIPEAPMPDPLADDNPFDPTDEADEVPDPNPTDAWESADLDPSTWTTKVRVGGAGGLSTSDVDGSLAPSFRRTVQGLRKSGLDIVFVFDSTGSMDRVLSASKRHILRMVEVLRVLVPEAQVGVVTFRDRGKEEEYLVRSVPLARTAFRSINFVNTIDAWGGGDEPEAVLEGLQEAFRMRWETGARRVVVLIGDAPPHDRSSGRLQRAISRFADDGLGQVHALITESSDIVVPNTLRAFQEVAEYGNGTFQHLESEDAILRQVLGLAFGTEYRASLDDLYERVTTRGSRIPTMVLELVRREDTEALTRQLIEEKQIDSVARAVAQRPTPALAEWMLDLLRDGQLDLEVRHAAAWCLCQIFDDPAPALDPETNKLIHRRLRATEQRVRAMRRPN